MKINNEHHRFRGALVGIAAGLGATILCIAACSWLICAEIIDETCIGYCIIATVLLSSFVSAWVTIKRTKNNNLIMCMITGSGYYAALLTITILFYEGQFTGMMETAMLVLCGSLCVFLCGFRENRKAKNRKKIRYSG